MTYLNDDLIKQIDNMENLDELSKFYMIENILEYYKNNKYESINRDICYFYWKIIYDDYDIIYSTS